MKIAVISDTHDRPDNLLKAINIANQHNCNYLLHLGDIISPYTARNLRNFKGEVKAVFGNCDGEQLGLKAVFSQIGGEILHPPHKIILENKKIILMHEPFLIDELIYSPDTDYIFYGHLHKVDYRRVNDTIIINPGDAAGLTQKPTFFIGDILTGDFVKFDI